MLNNNKYYKDAFENVKYGVDLQKGQVKLWYFAAFI